MQRADMKKPKRQFKPPAHNLRVGGVPIERREPTNPNLPPRALSDQNRKRLENIRAGENLKKKRERLCSVLIQKLVVKYGAPHEVLITALVDQFVEEKAQIAPEDLAKLEKEVVLALKTKLAKRTNVPASASASTQCNAAALESKASGTAHENSSASVSEEDLMKAPEPGSEWKVIAAYQELMSEEKNMSERLFEKNKKINFRKALDEHIRNAQEYKKKHLDSADASYNEHIRKDIQRYHEEERLKREKQHERAQQQLRIQKQQIADAKVRHEKEMKELAQFEQDMLAEAQAKIQEEADKVAAKRARAKEQQLIVDQDNERNQKIREEQAQKIAEEDQRMMEEYAAKLDKDEYERANAFAERMKKMEAFNEKFENDGAGKAIKEERIRMERLLLKEQAEAEERAAKKEHDKAMAKRLRLQSMMHENEKLVNAKLEKKEMQRVEDHHFAERALSDVARYNAEEKAKKDALHRKHMQYRKVLDQQMKNKAPQADPTSAAFIGREALVNKSLYEKAARDPKVLRKLNSPEKPKQTGPRIATHK